MPILPALLPLPPISCVLFLPSLLLRFRIFRRYVLSLDTNLFAHFAWANYQRFMLCWCVFVLAVASRWCSVWIANIRRNLISLSTQKTCGSVPCLFCRGFVRSSTLRIQSIWKWAAPGRTWAPFAFRTNGVGRGRVAVTAYSSRSLFFTNRNLNSLISTMEFTLSIPLWMIASVRHSESN